MLLLRMTAGALRLVGKLEKDEDLGTEGVRDHFTSKLLAGLRRVL